MREQYRIDQQHTLQDLVAGSMRRVLPVVKHSVRWKIRDRKVCLTGSVNSWYQKQLAQEALMQMTEVQEVVNLLHVKPASDSR